MGIEQRVPFQITPNLDVNDPIYNSLYQFATQSPIGCRYYDASSNWVTVNDTATTTLDFRSGGVQFDSHNMISVANDTVTIPMSGIWDCSFLVIADQATMAVNDFYMAQFGQGTGFAVSGLVDLHDTAHVSNAAHHAALSYNAPFYFDKATRAAGSVYTLRGYQDNAANTSRSMKIVAFCLWLRSPVIPSKY